MNSHHRLRFGEFTLARIGIYAPPYAVNVVPRCGVCMAAYVPTCAPRLCLCVILASRVAQQVPLGVRPSAAGGLACPEVQVQLDTPLGVPPTCRTPPHAQSSLRLLRCGSVLHAHRALELQPSSCFQLQDCSAHTHVQSSLPRQTQLSPATGMLLPFPFKYSTRYNPLGAVLSCRWALRPTSRSR